MNDSPISVFSTENGTNAVTPPHVFQQQEPQLDADPISFAFESARLRLPALSVYVCFAALQAEDGVGVHHPPAPDYITLHKTEGRKII